MALPTEWARIMINEKPIEWNDLLNWINSGQKTPLWRNPECSGRYIEHKKQVFAQYESMSDFIRIHYLQWNSHLDQNSKKHVAIHSSQSITEPVWTPNDYPYNFAHGIEHWLLWIDSTSDEPERLIEETVSKKFSSDIYDILTLINPPHMRSVADVFHAHVFIRMQ